MPIPFVGRRFTPKQFEEYLASISFSGFQPEFVTLHHTANPSLAMRPQGLTDAHLQNLLDYYQNDMGWSGGPHVFIDDRDNGIIVFQRLDRQGVHAKSFNKNSWGIEMLGNFDVEEINSGRGAKVRDMAVKCIALMNKRLGIGASTLRFHRNDPKTNKTCPGTKVLKPDILARVTDEMGSKPIIDLTAQPNAEWQVFLKNENEFKPVHLHGGRPIVPIRKLIDTLKPGGKFSINGANTQIKFTSKSGNSTFIAVAQIDEKGSSWGYVRDVCEAIGIEISVNDKRVNLLS